MERKFILIWFAIAALLAVTIGAIDIFVDPYLVFGSPRIVGLNARKSEIDTHEGLAKVYLFDRASPRTVVIGSSRVDLGLDSTSPAWPAEFRPVYDFGIPGAGMPAMRMYVSYAVRIKSPKLIVVSPEFESFLIQPRRKYRAAEGPSETELRLGLAGEDGETQQIWQQRAKDYFEAAFSLDAAEDSIRTLTSNRRSNSMDLSAEGNLSDAGFLNDVATDGQYTIFQQKTEEMFREYGIKPLPYYQPGGNPRMQDMRAILDLCATQHIKVIVLIQPSQVDRLEGFYLLGLWDQYEAWERDLTSLIARYQQNGDASPVLWDFTAFDPYSEEPLPNKGDRKTILPSFWEPVHYRKQLGNQMLQRIFGRSTTADFGQILTPQSIDVHLSQIRQLRAQYRRSDPEELKRLRQEYELALDEPNPR